MPRKKSARDIMRQIFNMENMSNYPYEIRRRHSAQIRNIGESMMKKALNRTSIGRTFAQMAEAEAAVYQNTPSYQGAAQRLGWLARYGNSEADQALNAKSSALGLSAG